MGFRDAVNAAGVVEPVLVPVLVGDELFSVEVRRLDGLDWVGVTSMCPPVSPLGVRFGFELGPVAKLACEKHGRLLDADGEPVGDVDWGDLFRLVSGDEVVAVASGWWGLNADDPSKKIAAVKKALLAGTVTS